MSEIAPNVPASQPRDRPRSCAICAQRKVRCDKQYPCGRCRRAGISCVLPSIDPRPQWARRLISTTAHQAGNLSTQSTPASGVAAESVLDRLKILERLVHDLSRELEEARATSDRRVLVSPPESRPSDASSTRPLDTDVPTPDTGRIILDDSNHVRYVSRGFWSRIDHELDGLKEDTRVDANVVPGTDFVDGQPQMTSLSTVIDLVDGQPQRTSSSTAMEADHRPVDRHSFLLKHSMDTTRQDNSALMPMTSQIPFLLEIFFERVHFITALPHMPSLRKSLQRRQAGRTEASSPSEEALWFSVFHAAICSMDDEEVASSFNVSKSELTLKYRIGLEQALAKADFLNNPSNDLIQAFILFLALARRYESPKYAWMMTGLVIRMAQYLGIHQDGSSSKHLTPFQVEMQRRTWWDLVALDMRVTEDQGTELAISQGSYSTRSPSNVNDTDLWPEMKEFPPERQEVTDVTFLRLCSEVGRHMQEMMAAGAKVTLDEHNCRLDELAQKWEREYFGLLNGSHHHAYLAAAGTIRVILGRLTLLTFPPVLYNSQLSTEIRTKLLVAAIEVAEHNHALNTDPSCQPWRWVYQTQQHWHAVIFLLVEICGRPWSPTMERAWIALQSPWLVPLRESIDKNSSIWAPVRRLMAKARKHRDDEVARLQTDPNAATRLAKEDHLQIAVPSSSTTFPKYFDPEIIIKRWRQLVQPVADTATSAHDNAHPTVSNPHSSPNFSTPSGSSLNADNLRGTASSLHESRQTLAPSVYAGAGASISEPWQSDAMDLTDYSNLDAFLGMDAEIGYLDAMNADDPLDFDWNGWFESAKGIL